MREFSRPTNKSNNPEGGRLASQFGSEHGPAPAPDQRIKAGTPNGVTARRDGQLFFLEASNE